MSTARNVGGEDLGQVSSIRQVGIAAFMGAMIEWYDFFLYGLAAAVVFNQLFFPSEEPLGGLAPFIATALLAWAGSYWPVALYIMAVSLVSFVSVYLATETFRSGLTEESAREPGAEMGRAGQAT